MELEKQDYSSAVATGEEDQGDVSLDVIPDSSSAGVREWQKRLPQLFMARQILLTLGVVGRYLYIATNASAKEARVLVKTQEGLFSVLKSIDATSLMLQSFQSGANNILEKLKVAYLYLLDGFPDFAKTDIDAIAKDIKTMRDSTEKALGVVRKTNSIEEAHRAESAVKNDLEEQLAAVQQAIDQLNKDYRKLNDGQLGGLDEQTNGDAKEDSGLKPSPTFLVFLKITAIAFLKDRISILIAVAIFVSFYVCDCHYYNSICGWVTMILVMSLFLLRFALWKVVQPKRVDYKPVIPIILVGAMIPLFCLSPLFPVYSCQLNASLEVKAEKPDMKVDPKLAVTLTMSVDGRKGQISNEQGKLISEVQLSGLDGKTTNDPKEDDSKLKKRQCKSNCFVYVILFLLLTILVLLLLYCFGPKHWVTVEVPANQPAARYDSPESLKEKHKRIRDELSKLLLDKQRIEASIGDADLTMFFLSKALGDLESVTGIIQQSTAVIEKWYKECKDVIEPSMGRTIQRAQAVPEEELGEYWNSMAFKKEVVGYYCRWRALQVYCETLRSDCREKRATLESHYVENLYPRDAVKRAWELADEEAADPEVARLVKQQKERMNGHDLIHRVNNRSRELKLDMPQ